MANQNFFTRRIPNRRHRYTLFVVWILLTYLLYYGYNNGYLQSSYSFLINQRGFNPYSDNFEKLVLDPAYLSGGQVVQSNDLSGRNDQGEPTYIFSAAASCPNNVPCLDIDGKPFPILGGTSSIDLVQDLRGKDVQFKYSYQGFNFGSGESCWGNTGARAQVYSNCGSKTIGSGGISTGIVEIISSKLNDKDYVLLLNNEQICAGSLKDGEKLRMGMTTCQSGGQIFWGFRWLFPFQCTAEPGMDLAYDDFQSGETVTITSAFSRWPKGFCNELSPILLNQSARGVEYLPELLQKLASPKRDEPPYVVPKTCNDKNDGGCVLRVAYWMPKDPSVPTACVDEKLQRAFNLNTKQCDDIINIRNFCTEGIVYNNECLTPTDVKAKFNCAGTMDFTGPTPICYVSQPRGGVSAYCLPDTGGIIEVEVPSKCPNGQDPFTSYAEACKASKGKIEVDKCVYETTIALVEKTTEEQLATAKISSSGATQITSLSGTSTIQDKLELKNKCQNYIPGEQNTATCATTTTEGEIIPFPERYLEKVLWFGYKVKFWLLVACFTIIIIIVWINRRTIFRRRRNK